MSDEAKPTKERIEFIFKNIAFAECSAADEVHQYVRSLQSRYESALAMIKSAIMNQEVMNEQIYVTQKGRHLDALVEYSYQQYRQIIERQKQELNELLGSQSGEKNGG